MRGKEARWTKLTSAVKVIETRPVELEYQALSLELMHFSVMVCVADARLRQDSAALFKCALSDDDR